MEQLPLSETAYSNVIPLFTDSFTDSDGEEEGKSVGDLVNSIFSSSNPEDIVAFITRDKATLVGCIIFTRVESNKEDNIWLLSPVAINTAFQREGVGTSLINHGINELKKESASLIVTYGDPRFYSRFGFQQISEAVIKPPFPLSHPQGWQALPLQSDIIRPIRGEVIFQAAFNVPSLW